ncbi:MAG: aminotransferase class V-fold PLP-dependent enzyme [Oscillospiraceae bacterium]
MVNFDNAATSYPKPKIVKTAVDYAMDKLGGSAGRGGHALAMLTSEKIFSARKTAAEFFGAEAENVVFTLNCTHALNLAVKGIMKDGGHIITSALEHNSVIRPIEAMNRDGIISYSVARVYYDDDKTVRSFRELITPRTKAIVCTLASNVTGQILPYRKIAALCREHNICFIADGAQLCGIIPVKLSDGINILCTAGHKGLYGITGTGLLVTDGKYHINHLMEGGTGSASMSLEQPDFLPDSLECGTLNTVGIMSVKAGMNFINNYDMLKIYSHEDNLCRKFIDGLKDIDNCIIYRGNAKYVPIVSFNVKDVPPEKTAEYLNANGFCLRAGLHCAGLAHKNIGTPEGTVRFAPSLFNNEKEVAKLIGTIKKFCDNNKKMDFTS